MRIELVNTGNELLLGDTINTNAAWIGQRIAALGLMVSRHLVVSAGAVIGAAIAEAASRSDVVLVSGGLGPTADDLTREMTAELLGLPLELDERLAQDLREFFAQRNRPMADSNLRQVMVPRGATVLPNPFGTAPGLYFPAELGRSRGFNTHVFLLPGPPRELKPMMENQVEPRLGKLIHGDRRRVVRYLKITGLGESDLVARVERDLEAIEGLGLGYCIRAGDVDLRLSGDAQCVGQAEALVRSRLEAHIVSDDNRLLEEVVVAELAALGQKVATAESCTGGLLSSRLTDIPGSSAVFGHGWVVYANEAKVGQLGVDGGRIAQHGAVSPEVALAMARGALARSGSDHALALTGIAGPGGGSHEKPVGTVFVALVSRVGPDLVLPLLLPGSRDRFKLMATQAALDMLRRRLLGLANREGTQEA